MAVLAILILAVLAIMAILPILSTLTLAAEVVEVVQVKCPDRGPAVAPLLDVVRLPCHGLHVVVADPLLGRRAVGVGAPLAGAALLRPALLHWNDSERRYHLYYVCVDNLRVSLSPLLHIS